MSSRQFSPVLGVFWMLVTGLLFVAVTVTVKHGLQRLPAAESAFLRYAFGLVLLLPLVPSVRRAGLARRDIGIFAGRGLFHTAGVTLWFFAMTQIPLAEVTALNFISPVYVTIGAAVFLGERLAARRILAVLGALLGAVIILRPGFREVAPGHVAMIFAGLAFGVSYLTGKFVADRFDATLVVFMLSLTVAVGLAPLAWVVWTPPTWAEVGWIAVVALLATLGHITMTWAFRVAPVAVTQPVTFLQLIWATALGALAFAEPIDLWVVAGGTIILGAVSFITWREAVLKRRAVTPPHMATKI